VREFFIKNETLILFAHGLVFFSLGFAVWLQRRRATRLVLSSSLIWLAAFAFVESLAVWGHVFVPIQERYVESDTVVDGLYVLRTLLQVTAFVFLVQFGLRLLTMSTRVRASLTVLSGAVWVTVLLGGALLAGALDWTVEEWEASSVAAARYALLLPGALLSAVGLWRQRSELYAAGMRGIKPYAATAAGVLAVYALAAGLIVDTAAWTPGWIANQEGWFSATSLPLEVVRGLAGLALCVSAVKLLEIFDVEAKQRLEATDRARLVAEERARFRRDLHDGTIQSIYAAGLHLEAIALKSDDRAVRGEVREVVGELNEATDGIRDYIRALDQAPATPEGIAASLEELTRHFAEETGREVRFAAEGIGQAGSLPDEIGQHLQQILREALANTARHAGPCRADVLIRFGVDEVDLVVDDDGRGIDRANGSTAGGGQGIRNMHERARRLGGRIVVGPGRKGGTRVALEVPLDIEEPGMELDGPRQGEATLR
jgi:signal transduction histidine kinase